MLRAELTSPGGTTWVVEARAGGAEARAEGGSLGLVMVYEESDPAYRHASLDISLTTEAQGKGYGPEALRGVAARLFQEGHHRLTIDPAADNDRAIAAYRKVGFRVVGRLREYQRTDEGGWEDGLLMELLARELT
jgi:aminoglycoside 6'-N-acetyltransferase